MSQKIDFEEFKKRLNETTNTIIPTSEYLGWNNPMDYHCLTCGHDWNVKEARYVIRGYGCPNCGKLKRIKALDTCHKKRVKTEEQFRRELVEKQPNLIPNDMYINNRTKYHCICKIHNCDVYKTPEKYLHRNQGCPMCSIENSKYAIRYNNKSFKEKVYEKNPNIILKSDFTGVKNNVNVECKVCGYNWSPIAEILIWDNPCGCPNCAGNAIKNPLVFETELKITHPELILLSPYIRSNKKVHVLCTDCGRDFWVTPNKLQQGQHCPFCKISHGERVIKIFLTNNGIEFEMQKKFDDLKGLGGRKLSYDFFIPSYNLLIEFQGEQHERPVVFKGLTRKIAEERFIKQQEHDKRKREYTASHDIKLLEIWYYDMNLINEILTNELGLEMSKSA